MTTAAIWETPSGIPRIPLVVGDTSWTDWK